jgi:hypothetical protein
MLLPFLFLGLVLNLIPQQGQNTPFHLMKISQRWHLAWPLLYLLPFLGLLAVYFKQIPLQPIILHPTQLYI